VQRRSAGDIKRRVTEMVEMVGLRIWPQTPRACRVGNSVAGAACPMIRRSLLDEPFSALDKNLRGQMQDEVRRLHRELGTTFVFVTHDQSEALALSNRVAIFERGTLQQIAAPKEIYERPQTGSSPSFLALSTSCP
jgi:putative spermidine/putrescine transport system ATP-binding protein